MKIIILTLLLILAPTSRSEIVVIGHINNPLSSLTRKQVQAIFMGRIRSISGRQRILPVDSVDLRTEFYEALTNRPIKQIDAYWARLTFSGESSPPPVLSKQQNIIDVVQKKEGKIAYISREKLDETKVKVLYVVN